MGVFTFVWVDQIVFFMYNVFIGFDGGYMVRFYMKWWENILVELLGLVKTQKGESMFYGFVYGEFFIQKIGKDFEKVFGLVFELLVYVFLL